MATIQSIVDGLMADKSVLKFSMKSRQDGLLFIKSKTEKGSSSYVEAITLDGSDLLNKARLTVGRERWQLCQDLKARGHTQQNIALIFDITQPAVNHMLSNEYEPRP